MRRHRRSTSGRRGQRLVRFVRRPLALFIVLVATGLALATTSVRAPERIASLRNVCLAVVAPPARLGAGLARSGGDLVRGVVVQHDAVSRLAEVQEENRDLNLRLLDRDELAAENQRFRDLLGLRARLPLRAVPARVLRLELAADRVLTIDRGSLDGVAPDQSVVGPDGVVGKVLSVSRGVAQVQLLTDPEAGLAVLVGDGQRRSVHAVVKDARGETARLRYVDPQADVEVGDPVVTSGLDQVHPKGLRVGEVVAVHASAGLENEIVVRPAVDVRRIEEVLVLVGPAIEPPEDEPVEESVARRADTPRAP